MSRPKKDTNPAARQKLLAAAGRAFRQGGYGGTGVDGLAREAGLTSGAFYSHFESKHHAFELAVHEGFEFFRRGVEALQARHGAAWIPALIDFYFDERMAVDLGEACVLPTLTADTMRGSGQVRTVYENDLRRLAGLLASGLGGDQDRAWQLLALFAGGASLARAVQEGKLSQEIVTAVRAAAHALCRAAPSAPPPLAQPPPAQTS